MAHARNHISVIRFAWHVFPGGQVFPGGGALAGGHGFPWPPGAPCGPGRRGGPGGPDRAVSVRPATPPLDGEDLAPVEDLPAPHPARLPPLDRSRQACRPQRAAPALRFGQLQIFRIRREPEPGVPVAAGHRLVQFDGLPGQRDHGSTAHVAPQVWSPLAPRPSWHRPNRLQLGDDPRKVNSSRYLLFRRNVGGRIGQNADLAPAIWSSVRWRRRSRSNGRRRASFRA